MKRISTLGLALGLGFALAGTASAQVKFGMAGPITGPSAATGAQMKNGVDQAAEDINKTGGIHGKTLRFVFHDDQSSPQVGVQRRMFVYDVGEGPFVVINPEIVESSGEWSYHEGCLSVPGLSWDLIRPKEVHLRGVDLDGTAVDIEADELLARCFQHEMDHLDGVLIVERLEDADRKEAMRVLRNRALDLSAR